MSDDPVGWLIKPCQHTASQEHRLRTDPFARDSEVFADDEPNEIAVDPTGIVMVSLPESSSDDSTPHKDFQTPLEDFLLTSSEEQRATTIVDGPADHRIVDENGGDTMAVERTVDLGQDSDNLRFSGLQFTQVIDCGDRFSGFDFSTIVVEIPVNKLSEDESNKFGELHTEPYESVSKKLKISENAGNQVLELESEIFESLDLGEDNLFVDLPLKEIEEIPGLTKADNKMCKNGEDSLASKNVDNQCASSSGVKGLLLKDHLDALKMVAEEVDYGHEDVDFLETAKNSGMGFPRPRWWPPEGFAGD